MIKILYDLIMTYMVPLLHFAGIYITDEGYIKPTGAMDDLVFQYNERDLIVVKHDMQYQMVKSKPTEFETFNPFMIARHMVFVANLILARINEIDDPPKAVAKYMNGKNKLIYDEDIDEYIPAEGVDIDSDEVKEFELKPRIEMKHSQTLNGDLNTISIVYVDKSSNPIKNIAPIVSYVAIDPIFATYGAILNLIKKYQKIFPVELMDTDVALFAIAKGVEKYITERKKKKSPEDDDDIDFDDEETLEQKIREADNTEYNKEYLLGISENVVYLDPWLKAKDLKIENTESIIYNSMLVPRFKIVEEEDFGTIIEKSKYDEIELNW